jgi:hypothetical protein
MSANKTQVGTDPLVIEALKEVTGAEVVRVMTGVDGNGNPTYEEGYQSLVTPGPDSKPAGFIYFYNHIGQHCQVPAHRVDALLKHAAKPAK